MGTLLTGVGMIVVLVVLYFLYQYFQSNQEERHDKSEVPRNRTVNDTNYNIDNTGIEAEDANLSPRAAAQTKQNWEETDYIPSDEEFYQVKKGLDGSDDATA